MVNSSIVKEALPYAVRSTSVDAWGEPYKGKVRDVYERGDRLVLVTTDRISAFDYILPEPIPFKGQVLNQLAAYFFEHTSGSVPNHVIDLPDPNVTIARRTEPFALEFVVRGYLAGHAWREYRDGSRELCGVPLPDGLQQNSKLPKPILTPATKAATGHDEDISADEAVSRGLISADEFEQLRDYAFELFDIGTKMAAKRGLILVDTKYEFGRTPDGELIVIDEIHTPDSSRYFRREGYEERMENNEPQQQLSKEFVREWLMANGFSGKQDDLMPYMSDEFRVEVALRYIELYELLTGSEFEPPDELNLAKRLDSMPVHRIAQTP